MRPTIGAVLLTIPGRTLSAQRVIDAARAVRMSLGVLLLVLFGQRAIVAQGAPESDRTRGTIDGIVTDTSLKPLAGASVTILQSNIRAQTEASGRFRFLRIPAGQYILIVRHLGHRPASGIVEVPANDTARLSYMLGPTSAQLERTVVTEQPLSQSLAEFDQRRRHEQGEFLTQSDIDRRNAMQTADLFRALSSVTVVPTKWGSFIAGRSAGCAAAVFVDNVLLPRGSNTEGLPSPRDIAAIEVYGGPATAPPQFAAGASSCGVVLIWTRSGS